MGDDTKNENIEQALVKQDHTDLVHLKQMKEMRDILRGAHWTCEGLNVSKPAPLLRPEHNLNGSQWHAKVEKKRDEILESRIKSISTSNKKENLNIKFKSNQVKIVDKHYLEKRFHLSEFKTSVDSTSLHFKLNHEQDRAFRIVANHAISPYIDQLRMYIGGMGGTGKTQVLKALVHFFEQQKESHQIMIVAPTGSAAALLGGSTYHSAFGINERAEVSNDSSRVMTCLTGVDYVFLEEVSMLSAYDMHKISAKLEEILGIKDKPFGGLNMIFAGDFAQLPPIHRENASLYG